MGSFEDGISEEGKDGNHVYSEVSLWYWVITEKMVDVAIPEGEDVDWDQNNYGDYL